MVLMVSLSPSMKKREDHLGSVLQDTSEKSLAYAYIWGNEGDPDLYGEWGFEVCLNECLSIDDIRAFSVCMC